MLWNPSIGLFSDNVKVCPHFFNLFSDIKNWLGAFPNRHALPKMPRNIPGIPR
jgi:hypothetical protein